MRHFFKENVLYIAWAVALISTAGSLYFSNIRGFPPCVLCWYQRICMYPLVAIIGVAILYKDKWVYRYALPLSVVGLGISFYHNLLYYGIIPESAAPCTAGVSCTTQFIQYFGFITIPFLSMCAFIIITAALLLYKNYSNEK